MAALSEQKYSVRFVLPHEVVYDKATILYAPVYLDGAVVTPTSGTITVYDDSDTVIVNAQAVTVNASNIAQYSIAADTFNSTDVSERLRVVWAITISATVYTFENDGIVCSRVLYPVITDEDLFRRMSALDPSGTAPITAKTHYQDYIDESWVELMGLMIEGGYRPTWTMSPSSLRRSHTLLCMAHIFEDLASRLNIAYADRAGEYRQQFAAAFKSMTVLQDADGDGQPERPGRQSVTNPTIWLSGGGSRFPAGNAD